MSLPHATLASTPFGSAPPGAGLRPRTTSPSRVRRWGRRRWPAVQARCPGDPGSMSTHCTPSDRADRRRAGQLVTPRGTEPGGVTNLRGQVTAQRDPASATSPASMR